MAVSTDILRGFAAILRERGIDTTTLLREAGADAHVLADHSHQVSVADAISVVSSAYRLSGDPALALRVGTRAPLQSLGVLGSLAAYCPTARTCIGQASAYVGLLLPMAALRLVEDKDLARLTIYLPFTEPRFLRAATELMLAFAVRIGRQFAPLGEGPNEVAVAYPTPRHAQSYSNILRCPVRFDAMQTEIVFPASHLDEAQLFLDDSLFRLLKNRADAVMMQHGHTNMYLHERVRQVLRHRVDLRGLTPRTIASQLNIGVRRLRYSLAQEGHSLRLLIDEARREVSLKAIMDKPIKWLSHHVGFSDVAAFMRAFKRWTGTSPGRYRASQRPEPVKFGPRRNPSLIRVLGTGAPNRQMRPRFRNAPAVMPAHS